MKIIPALTMDVLSNSKVIDSGGSVYDALESIDKLLSFHQLEIIIHGEDCSDYVLTIEEKL